MSISLFFLIQSGFRTPTIPSCSSSRKDSLSTSDMKMGSQKSLNISEEKSPLRLVKSHRQSSATISYKANSSIDINNIVSSKTRGSVDDVDELNCHERLKDSILSSIGIEYLFCSTRELC